MQAISHQEMHMSQPEVARKLGISVATVRIIEQRALSKCCLWLFMNEIRPNDLVVDIQYIEDLP